MDMTRGMLKAKGMPNYFWAEAITCAVYLINRSPIWSIPNTTPIEAWSRFKPNVQHLKVFGVNYLCSCPQGNKIEVG